MFRATSLTGPSGLPAFLPFCHSGGAPWKRLTSSRPPLSCTCTLRNCAAVSRQDWHRAPSQASAGCSSKRTLSNTCVPSMLLLGKRCEWFKERRLNHATL